MRRTVCTVVGLMLGWAVSASAQVVNPTAIEFTSPDHAIVTRYEVGYFAGTATAPTQSVSIPKSEFTAQPEAYWRHALPRPVLGNYTAKVRTFAPDDSTPVTTDELASAWSDPSGPFTLSPRALAGLRVVP